MTEAFLFHAWQCRLFKTQQLYTQDNEPVQIIHPGLLNTDAGPDFTNARIRIGETLWAGNVEIHMKSSDWKKHLHQFDQSYANIILHVVYEANEIIERPDGSNIPVLVLKDLIYQHAWKNYQFLLTNQQWIPCASQLKQVPELVFNMQVSRMLTERLERKTQHMLTSLRLNIQNWEETFYQHLAINFGFKTNALPFELLAKALPENILARHKDNLFQTEAMIFGTAGLLEHDFKEEHPVRLKEEFRFLRNKFNLKPVEEHLWKFLRLRPANFPTIRLAQFSSLVVKSNNLFSKILETTDIRELLNLLSVDVSAYWKNHFIFGHASNEMNKSLGVSSIYNIIINTVVPFLFVYGNQKGLPEYRERAISFLEQLPAEKNNLIRSWQKHGYSPKSAAQSQGMIELKNNYCDAKKCLQCSIGNKILQIP